MQPRARDSEGRRVVYVDRALWQRLAQAGSTAEFARAWLALQCSMFRARAAGAGQAGAGAVRAAVVVCGEPDVGPFRPVARFPDETAAGGELDRLCEAALEQGEPQVQEPRDADDTLRLAYPVGVDGRRYGVVGVELPAGDPSAALRELQWGSAWLDAWFRREHAHDEEETVERLMRVLDLLAVALGKERFRTAAAALATALATELECDRVSIGVLEGGQSRLVALSHSALDDGRMNLLRAIAAAMDEAIDQGSVLRCPGGEDGALVTREHRRLLDEYGNGAVLTVPLGAGGRPFGAILLERPAGASFDDGATELCKSVALAVGDLLDMKRRSDRHPIRKALDAITQAAGSLLGRRHPVRKLAMAAVVALIAFATLATGTWRVTADALVEGAIRRVVTAPIDGYLVAVDARPGDAVAADQVLARFDDRDLRLQRLRLESERGQLLARLQDVTARGQRAEAMVVAAEIEQREAELELIDEQLARTELRAPFDGIVIDGDLSQSLGAPITRGTPLLEVAPLDAWRVVLEVDEHDVAALRAGQPGTVLLAALPSVPLALTVRRITPIASAVEGRNVFRVEADLDAPATGLAIADTGIRPGMRGVAKIGIEERRLAWIWTHELTRWLRLRLWAWLP